MPRVKINGYTLIELLVGLVLGALTMVWVYQIFASQQQLHLMQQRTVQLQQNLRATLQRMAEEIRMAAYDPKATGAFGFLHQPDPGDPDYGRATATAAIAFTTDADGNGTLDNSDLEQVGFRLNVAQDGSALAGTAGKTPDHVLRKFSCGAVSWQPFAQDIETVRFVYFDHAGTIVPEADLPGRLNEIRGVQISLVGRQTKQEKNYSNRHVYRDPQGDILYAAPGDHLRRQMVTSTVTCRNRVEPW